MAPSTSSSAKKTRSSANAAASSSGANPSGPGGGGPSSSSSSAAGGRAASRRRLSHASISTTNTTPSRTASPDLSYNNIRLSSSYRSGSPSRSPDPAPLASFSRLDLSRSSMSSGVSGRVFLDDLETGSSSFDPHSDAEQLYPGGGGGGGGGQIRAVSPRTHEAAPLTYTGVSSLGTTAKAHGKRAAAQDSDEAEGAGEGEDGEDGEGGRPGPTRKLSLRTRNRLKQRAHRERRAQHLESLEAQVNELATVKTELAAVQQALGQTQATLDHVKGRLASCEAERNTYEQIARELDGRERSREAHVAALRGELARLGWKGEDQLAGAESTGVSSSADGGGQEGGGGNEASSSTTSGAPGTPVQPKTEEGAETVAQGALSYKDNRPWYLQTPVEGSFSGAGFDVSTFPSPATAYPMQPFQYTPQPQSGGPFFYAPPHHPPPPVQLPLPNQRFAFDSDSVTPASSTTGGAPDSPSQQPQPQHQAQHQPPPMIYQSSPQTTIYGGSLPGTAPHLFPPHLRPATRIITSHVPQFPMQYQQSQQQQPPMSHYALSFHPPGPMAYQAGFYTPTLVQNGGQLSPFAQLQQQIQNQSQRPQQPHPVRGQVFGPSTSTENDPPRGPPAPSPDAALSRSASLDVKASTPVGARATRATQVAASSTSLSPQPSAAMPSMISPARTSSAASSSPAGAAGGSGSTYVPSMPHAPHLRNGPILAPRVTLSSPAVTAKHNPLLSTLPQLQTQFPPRQPVPPAVGPSNPSTGSLSPTAGSAGDGDDGTGAGPSNIGGGTATGDAPDPLITTSYSYAGPSAMSPVPLAGGGGPMLGGGSSAWAGQTPTQAWVNGGQTPSGGMNFSAGGWGMGGGGGLWPWQHGTSGLSPINGSGMMSGISPLEKREDRPF